MSQSPARVEVQTSSIQGLGVFAGQSFGTDDLISRVNVVREVTDAAPLRPELGELVEHCAYPEDKVVLYGLPDRHLNHSCDPNAYEWFEIGGPVIRARRGIASGEEVTLDYNINLAGGGSWSCHCGARRCRGETLGSYFRLPLEIQVEYLPVLADWFVARHKQRIDTIRKAGA